MIRRRRLLIIAVIVIVVLVLIAAGWWIFRGLQSSSNSTIDQLIGQLPGSGQSNRVIERDSSGDSNTSQSTPSASPTPTISARRLGVTVAYKRDPSFSLTIDEIKHTQEAPTTQFYRPVEGAPYSIVRILDEGGRTIAEEQFAVTTGGILEGPDIAPQIIGLESSTAYLVIPIPESSNPVSVQISTPTSVIFDEAPVPQRTVLERLRDAFWVRPVYAQGTDDRFTIVVISDVGVGSAGFFSVVNQTKQMLFIDPWSKYAGQVDVLTVSNGINLGCNGAGNFVTCSNDATAMGLAYQADADWDAIIIVTSAPCDCGYVGLGFPPITAVGQGATQKVLVHELGHSIGHMIDEYGYQQGGFTQLPRTDSQNCFGSEALCEDALKKEGLEGQPGAQCSLGCSQVNTWRPATRIMHNSYNTLKFGPLEECYMGRKIAQAIGQEHDCSKPTPSNSPIPTPTPDGYWGWIAP